MSLGFAYISSKTDDLNKYGTYSVRAVSAF